MNLDPTAPIPDVPVSGSVKTAPSDAAAAASILSLWKRSLRVLPITPLREVVGGETGVGPFAGDTDRLVAVLAGLAGRLETELAAAVERLVEEFILDRLLSARLGAGTMTGLSLC